MTQPDYIENQLDRIEAKVDQALTLLAAPGTVPPVVTPPTPVPTLPPTSRIPAVVLPILKTWTITTTTGKQGSPDNLYPAKIGAGSGIIPGVFYVQEDGGVVFHATVNGFHTPNSKFCRVEGRQMADANWTKAGWNSGDKVHELRARLSLDARGLTKRARINGLQIHDGADDVGQLMLHESQGLGWMHKDGKEFLPLDPGYVHGTVCDVVIRVEGGKVKVTYNGSKTVEASDSGSGWYFKAGAYLQETMAPPPDGQGAPASDFGRVIIYSLTATGSLT